MTDASAFCGAVLSTRRPMWGLGARREFGGGEPHPAAQHRPSA